MPHEVFTNPRSDQTDVQETDQIGVYVPSVLGLLATPPVSYEVHTFTGSVRSLIGVDVVDQSRPPVDLTPIGQWGRPYQEIVVVRSTSTPLHGAPTWSTPTSQIQLQTIRDG